MCQGGMFRIAGWCSFVTVGSCNWGVLLVPEFGVGQDAAVFAIVRISMAFPCLHPF
jgi:hypothetical protein